MSDAKVGIVSPEQRMLYSLFSDKEMAMLEDVGVYKMDKPFFACHATKRARPAKPEEIVRRLWISRLVTKCRYPAERIAFEIAIERDEAAAMEFIAHG